MDANNLCRNFIDQIYLNYITTIKRNPKIAIMIHHDSFTHPINTPFIYKSQLNSDLIWRYFENVVQSKKNNPHFMTNEAHKILVSFKIANVLTGSGRPATVPRPNRAPAGGQSATVYEDKGVFKNLSNTY